MSYNLQLYGVHPGVQMIVMPSTVQMAINANRLIQHPAESSLSEGDFMGNLERFDLPDQNRLYFTMGDTIRLQVVNEDLIVTTMEFDRLAWSDIITHVAERKNDVILSKRWPVELNIVQVSTNPGGPRYTQLMEPVTVQFTEIGETAVRTIAIPFVTWLDIDILWDSWQLEKDSLI